MPRNHDLDAMNYLGRRPLLTHDATYMRRLRNRRYRRHLAALIRLDRRCCHGEEN